MLIHVSTAGCNIAGGAVLCCAVLCLIDTDEVDEIQPTQHVLSQYSANIIQNSQLLPLCFLHLLLIAKLILPLLAFKHVVCVIDCFP